MSNLVFWLGVFFFILGTMVGSFLNVVVWRLPRGESLSRPPSHCPRCGHFIRAWENIPVLSWLLLRGRCSACRLPISWRYPAGELAVGGVFLALYWRLWQAGLPLAAAPALLWLLSATLAAALIDGEHRLIPDKLTFSGMGAAVVLALVFPEGRLAVAAPSSVHSGSMLVMSAGRALIGVLPWLAEARWFALFDALLGAGVGLLVTWTAAEGFQLFCRGSRRALVPLGRGDVKFMGMAGAFLGADAVFFTLLGGSLLGFVVGLGIWLAMGFRCRRLDLGYALPFAPFLALAIFAWVLSGNWLYRLLQLWS